MNRAQTFEMLIRKEASGRSAETLRSRLDEMRAGIRVNPDIKDLAIRLYEEELGKRS